MDNASPARTFNFKSAMASALVSPAVSIQTLAPFSLACLTRRNALHTASEEPTTSTPEALDASSFDVWVRPGGKESPKKTTSGFSTPVPQLGHDGTTNVSMSV
eukprot:CAMPEP_0118802992 /NCGR_PEP_ID=MMETSP1161-20130426/13601_1 /TAXON_ID=249345 /ORGANISM="Picochlorum oklahomensis, Strain CCMP2329" /LENGTH=102 /DNA_ID=CAMNT_0006731385 /DNA_START=127 /DNA_END=432 /DNA_ORIENTATION=-